ncbi:proteasome activator complex subunit 2 [Thecamonas trahens ATCC 50062]|uniref:Proteasome activator complex subunit 2 n=1 Tax=Thecamonas trahens ATCC 50062 TaxID=461836 RepID=A0A0L0D2T3_THETB|nr:proteasome activator complex subunit 2 [Thecamonas trahens ATCC 50062]KNC46622.1 proteasome activator complex subunit 2 [Thecamonas trahens ATCC 50062]|eukprot:XP_013760395.1 proteasome activator complex subunit 2 [Thecamonas trahens ATCC 50062]
MSSSVSSASQLQVADPALTATIEGLKTDTKDDALRLVYKVMPQKIVYLSNIFQNPAFNLTLECIKNFALPEALQPSGVEPEHEPAASGPALARSELPPLNAVPGIAADVVGMETEESTSGAAAGGGEDAGKKTDENGKPALKVELGANAGLTASATGTPSKKRKRADDDDVASGSVAAVAEYPRTLPVPSNAGLKTILAIIKKELLELIYTCNTIKVWVQLNIPRIEDGNNFGVSVQEEIVSELSRAEESGLNVLESITKYFLMRARVVAKMLKWRQVEDYAQAIRELDEKEFITMKLCGLDLRNNYHILYDLITKNMEKLAKPRDESGMVTMY